MATEGSMNPVRWGLLGTGSITDKVVPGARRSDRVTFVAAGSRTLERAEAYAAPKGIPRAHGSYEALLDDPDVEAVYISLPNSMHHEWTMQRCGPASTCCARSPIRPARRTSTRRTTSPKPEAWS